MPIVIKNKECYKFLQKCLKKNRYEKYIKEYLFYRPKRNGELKNSVMIMYNNKSDSLKYHGQISYWDISLITDTVLLFNNQDHYYDTINNFNEDLSCWDVSNVKNMYGMFYNCYSFNQPLNDWNVSNVTYMKNMFYNCYLFNQELCNWNIENVTTLTNMFRNCKCFNQSLNEWNINKVNNFDSMLYNCNLFNRKNIKKWSLDNIKNALKYTKNNN